MKKYFLFIALLFNILAPNFSIAQDHLTPELLWKLGRLNGGDLSPDGQTVLYTVSYYNMEVNSGNTDIYTYHIPNKKILQITNTPFNEFEVKWAQNGDILFLSPEAGSIQLYRISNKGLGKTQVSAFTGEVEGFVLSPDESKIATLQSVQVKPTLTEIYPDLQKANAHIVDDLHYRHWNQWTNEYIPHIFIGPKNADNLYVDGQDIQKGEKFAGVMLPFGGSEGTCFLNNDQFVYASKKKLGKEFAFNTNNGLYLHDLAKNTTVDISTPNNGYDNAPALSPNGKQLAWLAMGKNGFEADRNVLQVYDLTTKTIKALPLNQDLTVDQFSWKKDGTGFLFVAPFRGVNQLFQSDLSGKVLQLTTGKMNVVHYSEGKDRIILGLQSITAPTDLYSFSKSTKTIERLTQINQELLSNISLPKVEERWVKTSDGKEMLTWVVLPPNFDATKKYPTLLYCQGGPQSMVSQFFSYRWNLMLMASQDYIIVAPNRRGLPGFGQEWNDAISKDWGGQPIRDYLAAIDDMSKESYVDQDRLGAVGASYGGYSVYYLAGIHEKRFKTFVSHCGLFNLESWYGTTEELFFADWDIGGPYWKQENKELYEKNSPHKMVGKWDTPILVIHGGIDFRVPESEGMQAFQAAQILGLKSKYLHFPTEGHWVQKPQNGLLWQREFFKWLDEDLKD
ncbi:MAG: S9 family peptidase [Bacteroidetes bacterium]|nr:S9 family peptidase [Bacteroidota bacterium]